MGERRASSGRVVSGGNGERLIWAGGWGVWQHVVGWEVRVASGGGMIMCIRGVRWIGEYIDMFSIGIGKDVFMCVGIGVCGRVIIRCLI